jgi:uncharacterized protein
MEIIGYLCATLVGVSLGLLGSGGSILTLPIMVYLLNIDAVTATGYSLFVVGLTSLIGCFKYVFNRLVDLKTAFIFAVPSIAAVFLTRRFLMPAIPNRVVDTGSFIISKELFILSVFAALMVIVGYTMIRKPTYHEPLKSEFHHYNYPMLITVGFISGVLTGIVGIGGGFIIIPALVLFARIPIIMSVGTSLLIIAANSFIGFAGELLSGSGEIKYRFLFMFSLFSVTGIFIGFSIVKRIHPDKLKKLFGWFILFTGIIIFINEIFLR